MKGMWRQTAELDGYNVMFAHKYLVRELPQGNTPQDLKQHYVAKQQASNLESRNEDEQEEKQV